MTQWNGLKEKIREHKDRRRHLRTSLLCFALVLALTSCSNSRFRNSVINMLSPLAPTSTSDTYTLSTVSISASSSDTASVKMNLFIDTQRSPQPISNWCDPYTNGEDSTKRCQCVFTWSEANTESGSTVKVARKVVTDVTVVQPNLLSCAVPGVYATEIQNGTLIKVSVVPGPGNSGKFATSTYNYPKSASYDPGSFRDYQGRSFMNILRYSCYDQRTRGMSIVSKMSQVANDTTGEVIKFPIANRFCVQKMSSSGTNGAAQDGCEGLPGPDYTAQANYFNLYVRESEVGDINHGNSRFVCPTVNESLSGASTIGSGGQYWPLDSSFALSLGRTGDFSVGVVANSRASISGDPVSSSSACDGGTSTGTSNGTGLTATCLGFAAKPASDGSCPSLNDSVGNPVQTFRLRRYVALYPQIFDTNGDFVREGQPVDTVYVVDRPVTGPSGEAFSMRGPKPCPYSYFDNKGLVNGFNGYFATNDSGWSGKNVDGIEFPNVDSENSCSALLPLVNQDRTVMTVTTINAKNPMPSLKRVYMRPIKPWAPHYEEDTSFQACTPLANPLRDPPLHFAKNAAGNVAWCAEAYPTQNNNVAKLDVHTTKTDPSTPYSGNVRPFTSHVSKNSTSGACTYSAVDIPSNAAVMNYYPASGKAYHLNTDNVDTDKSGTPIRANQTCDRTAINPNGSVNWPRFPLLAPPSAVESALASSLDTSFACTVTWDNSGAKSGKNSPTQGCCGTATQVWTGATAAPNDASNAHLEPGASGNTACSAPNY